MSKKTCWASKLGDCSSKFSKEHILSECLFKESEKVTISGVDWTKEETKEIPIATAYAYILCEKHNNNLSPVDTAAKEIQESFSKFYEKAISQDKKQTPFSQIINGTLFERWILKTTINHLFYSPKKYNNYPIDPYLVDLAFGLTPFEYQNKWGLHLVNPSLQNNILHNPRSISVYPIIINHELRPILIGSLLNIFGWSFFVNLVTHNLSLIKNGVNLVDNKYYHPPEIALFDDGKYDDNIKILFNYSTNSQPPK